MSLIFKYLILVFIIAYWGKIYQKKPSNYAKYHLYVSFLCFILLIFKI